MTTRSWEASGPAKKKGKNNPVAQRTRSFAVLMIRWEPKSDLGEGQLVPTTAPLQVLLEYPFNIRMIMCSWGSNGWELECKIKKKLQLIKPVSECPQRAQANLGIPGLYYQLHNCGWLLTFLVQRILVVEMWGKPGSDKTKIAVLFHSTAI